MLLQPRAEQALAAEKAARRLGVNIEIVYADNDAVSQSQQILKRIQNSVQRPDAIILEPVSVTAMPQVARAALAGTEVPQGRFGTVDEVSGLVAFLAGSRASYINGAVIRVNGGLYT